MPFLPPNVDNDQSGMSYVNPIMAALSGGAPASQPAPAPVSGGAAATPAPSGGGFLSSLFGGGASNPMGNPIGNALMGHGNFLVPLLAGLLGGKTPEQQRLAAAQAVASGKSDAISGGIAGLDEAIQGGGSTNQIIHRFYSSPAGQRYFASAGAGGEATVLNTIKAAQPGGGMTAEQKNFNAMLDAAGINTPEGRSVAAKQHLGLIKYVPRVTINKEGTAVPTGQYDRIDTVTNKSTPVDPGSMEAKVAAATTPAVPAPAAGATPATSAATPATPATTKSAAGEDFHPLDADVAEGGGWVPHYLQKGGSALSNVAPGAFNQERAAKINGLKQIDAATSSFMDLYKRGGVGGVVAPISGLLHVSDLAQSSPQEAVAAMIAGRQWAERELAGAKDILSDPAQAHTDAATKANLKAHALTQYLSILPPLKTTTYPDGTTVMGLTEEAAKLHNAPATESPIGGLISGIPQGAKEAGDAALDIGKSVGKAIGTKPGAPAQGDDTPPKSFTEDPKLWQYLTPEQKKLWK